MLKSKTFLGIDFGAGSLKIAEFAVTPQEGLRLLRFGVKSLGLAGSQDAAREGVLKKALPELLAEGGFLAKEGNLSAPGFQVFSKFVKLPPVDTSKVTQIIQYEAQQNVPFPLAETAWDYQILGSAPGGELEVLLVAIKSDAVEKLFTIGEGAGLKMSIVDSGIGALANAFRYNYADQEGCSLLLDIGAKTSNVLLFDGTKYYARSVNVGANAITQEFAAEAKLRFDDAEKFKIAEGFVSLGGAYEEPDDPKQAAVSKVARNVLTRLHLQVNQTIQFYRTQQGGAAPVRVFLCGGGSILPYASQFFQEKLNLPVDFLNPFRNVEIDPAVNVAELEKYAQCFGEVVGLGLRNVAQCPVELNLMPKASLARQEFNSKKPYLLAAAFVMAAGVFASGWYYSRVADARKYGLSQVESKVAPIDQLKTKLETEEARLKREVEEATQLGNWLQDRTQWADILVELRRIMKQTEELEHQKLGIPVGLWIDVLLSTEPSVNVASAEEEAPNARSMYAMDPVLARRYGLVPRTPPPEGGGPGGEGAPKPKSASSTNELATIKVTFRAVHLNDTANNDLIYTFEKEVKSSPLFDAKETQLSGNVERTDTSSPTFTFPLSLKLKRPIKL
ncbi:MAG TPA: type IV pilus assembly protein PilM [Candidatus Limnocylindria bacterium]|nr:type IV pilus assembly protein PilM [Candidatus Limnocylindria bacterium]